MSLSCDVVAERGGFRLEARFAGAARVLAVEGPSGAGKTSLLHAIAGLIPVERAVVSVDGRALVDAAGVAPGAHLRRIGYVFQDARLFPHLTVAGNIAFPRRGRPLPAGVQALIDLLDLGPLLGRWPRNLSGGETRRVAVARALACDPRLLLLDEPFAGLDAARRDELIAYLVALKARTRLPMLLVSHDPRDTAALADDAVQMRHGRIV